MAFKTPFSICKHPHCKRIVKGDDYCEEHQDFGREKHRKFQKRRPDKDQQTFYQSKFWKNRRLEKLKQNPVCEKCKRAEAKIVHHVISRQDGGTDDINNLQSLCTNCHNKIHGEQRRRLGS